MNRTRHLNSKRAALVGRPGGGDIALRVAGNGLYGYRGLRANQAQVNPKSPFPGVYDTSVQVRLAVIFSTVIIVVVFAPIFSFTRVEGRIFAPMGFDGLSLPALYPGGDGSFSGPVRHSAGESDGLGA